MRATAQIGRKLPAGRTFPREVSERELRAEFAAIVKRFPRKIVANAANVVEKTVDYWREEKSLPGTDKTFNIARSGGELGAATWAWMQARCGHSGDVEFLGPHADAEYQQYLAFKRRADKARD